MYVQKNADRTTKNRQIYQKLCGGEEKQNPLDTRGKIMGRGLLGYKDGLECGEVEQERKADRIYG